MSDRLPDAVLVPLGLKRGKHSLDRIDSILEVAEPLLGIDLSKEGHPQIREQVQPEYNGYFVTRDKLETLRFPIGHPDEGKERYDWVFADKGIRLGYLKGESDAV